MKYSFFAVCPNLTAYNYSHTFKDILIAFDILWRHDHTKYANYLCILLFSLI